MKHLLYSVLTAVSIMCMVACGSYKNVVNPDTFGVTVDSVVTMSLDTLNIAQMDSMCVADELPAYANWTKTYLKDGSINKGFEWATLYDPTTGIVYTVKNIGNDKFVVMKRITRSKK